ncbi:hypothetical protein J6590_057373 [Homalodisca vitripennis]|nr:hypothetical protein J6590_057373 [Homalodisca vitripennis]
MAAVAVADCEEYADTDIKAHSPSPNSAQKAENPRDGGLVVVTMAAAAVADCEEYADTDIKVHSPSPNSAQKAENPRDGGLVAVTLAAAAVADCEEYADTDIKAYSPSPNSAQLKIPETVAWWCDNGSGSRRRLGRSPQWTRGPRPPHTIAPNY